MPAKRLRRSKAPLQGILLLLLAALIGLAFATHNAVRPACGPLADSLADRCWQIEMWRITCIPVGRLVGGWLDSYLKEPYVALAIVTGSLIGGWLIDTPGMRALRLNDAADGIEGVGYLAANGTDIDDPTWRVGRVLLRA